MEILKWWNHLIKPEAKVKAPIAPVKGQGLIFTKWNGWFECVVINLLL